MGRGPLAALLLLAGLSSGARVVYSEAGAAGADDAGAAGAAGATQRSPDLPAYYHTTQSIVDAVAVMANPSSDRYCKGMSVVQASQHPAIPVVHLSRAPPGTSRRRRRRLFFLFGEHARELISPETGLRMIEDLCGFHDETRTEADALLAFYDVRIVLVANPLGRARVEAGEFCRRTNEHDVDLNRNWPDHFQFQPMGVNSDTFSGPRAMSEPETRALVRTVAEWPPHVFITVHSGTMGMYTPYAYSKALPSNVDAMLAVLQQVNGMYCNCPMGAAGKQVGYVSSGTCLDYVYDRLGTQYAFAVEIYSSEMNDIQQQWRDLERQEGAAAAVRGDSDSFRFAAKPGAESSLRGGASLLETGGEEGASMSPQECLSFFNPVTQERYSEVTQQWSKTLMAMARKVMERGDLPDHPPVPATADVTAVHAASQASMQPTST